MLRIPRIAGIGFLILSGAVSAAGTLIPKVTTLRWEAVAREGVQYREILAEAIEAVKQDNIEGARSLLMQIFRFCESKKTSDETAVVSFTTLSEFATYTASLEEDASVVWVDLVCPSSYKMLAFLDVSAGESAQALGRLQSAISMAPFWAEPHAEVGFINNQLGEFEQARDAYMTAIRLAETYEGSRYVMPMALRGLGYSLIELGDLDAAEKAFKESLELEPNNEIAEHELMYIQAFRAAQN